MATQRHYYARHCTHGVNVVYEFDGVTNSNPGDILRFDNAQKRDAYVAEDDGYDTIGTACREALPGKLGASLFRARNRLN